jgi:hypothetical protein
LAAAHEMGCWLAPFGTPLEPHEVRTREAGSCWAALIPFWGVAIIGRQRQTPQHHTPWGEANEISSGDLNT